MKYIVTGGAGFIGSNLVDALLKNNHQVEVIDNFSTGLKENCNSKALYHNIDISDNNRNAEIIKIMKNADGVFHLAALPRVQPSIDDPFLYEKNNTLSTINILKCAADANIKRFVYSASSSAYGDCTTMPLKEDFPVNPISPYALQKFYGEVVCKTFNQIYGIETVSLRYFNVFGERQPSEGAYTLVLATFMKQKLNSKPLTIRGDGEQKRDFTYVGDIVNANILAMSSTKVGSGEVINIGSGENRTVNHIAKLVGGETINIEPVIEPFETLADISKAKDLLDWEPKMSIDRWVENFYNKK